MTEDEIIAYTAGLPGVVAMTAGPHTSAPEAAWGHTFFFFDPTGDSPANQRFPHRGAGAIAPRRYPRPRGGKARAPGVALNGPLD
ncbi:hypothetical protein [Lacisediminihabitans sp.]|uniref:hypothetical protein n=1 Tax=Lacisediminihabitans sp. TaxID=2787631 RepID=UPI00374D624D